jgi:D-alanine-D-alanine ligase
MKDILLLAQFVPTDGVMLRIPRSHEECFYAETYHQKIIDSLKKQKYSFDSASEVEYLSENHSKYKLVWSLYNRLNVRNSEILIQSLCEYYGIKYIGAAPNIRALVEDKSMSKQLAKHIGLNTAKWVVTSKQCPMSDIIPFPGPYFVKPRFGSASIGIDESCICKTWYEATCKANSYLTKNIEVIVEEYIDGIYYGVPILSSPDVKPLVSIPHYQISNKPGNVITYSQKRFSEPGMERFISNDATLNKIITHAANEYYSQMQPCDYARVDFIIDSKSGTPYFLEVNVLMNLGIKSGFIYSFLKSHFNSYDEIICHIINLGLAKLDQLPIRFASQMNL